MTTNVLNRNQNFSEAKNAKKGTRFFFLHFYIHILVHTTFCIQSLKKWPEWILLLYYKYKNHLPRKQHFFGSHKIRTQNRFASLQPKCATYSTMVCPVLANVSQPNLYTSSFSEKSIRRVFKNRQNILPRRQKTNPVDFDDELKIGDVRYKHLTLITI